MWDKILQNPESIKIIMIFSIPIVAIVGYYVHEVLKNRSDNELKKSMLERAHVSAPSLQPHGKVGENMADAGQTFRGWALLS